MNTAASSWIKLHRLKSDHYLVVGKFWINSTKPRFSKNEKKTITDYFLIGFHQLVGGSTGLQYNLLNIDWQGKLSLLKQPDF